MPFFTFSQNNSGGNFHVDEDVCEYVIIEAPNDKTANALATTHGIYFDGVSQGRDCGCCGDRWPELGRWGEDKGDKVPSIYGTPLADVFAEWSRTRAIVYYLDGRKEFVEFKLRGA